MSLEHQVLCIEKIDGRGVASMTNHMGRFVHFSHSSRLIRTTDRKLRLGETVMVNKPDSEMHEQIGVVCNYRDRAGEPGISVSFDGEIYCFSPNELAIA